MNNRFEDSRIAQGTLKPGGNEVGPTASQDFPRESAAISRQDERDGASRNSGTSDITQDDTTVVNTGTTDQDLSTGNLQNKPISADKPPRRVLTAGTLAGDRVRNKAGEDLGKIEEIMIDIPTGRVAYAVLSFGGFLGIGDKLFAVPWESMSVDEGEHQFVLDVDRKVLESAPGFDKNNWPDMADPSFGASIHQHYGQTPYWQHDTTDAGDYVGDDKATNRSMEFEPTVGYRAGGK